MSGSRRLLPFSPPGRRPLPSQHLATVRVPSTPVPLPRRSRQRWQRIPSNDPVRLCNCWCQASIGFCIVRVDHLEIGSVSDINIKTEVYQ
uniref:Uncharacterized protein n=1 Tax=Leersia perrieri TaxID=77586 RepID=A0A0D9VFP8_9ORYZ